MAVNLLILFSPVSTVKYFSLGLTTWRHTGKTGRAQRERAHCEMQSNWGDLKPGSALDTFIVVALKMHLLDKDSTSQRMLLNRMAHSTLFRLAGLLHSTNGVVVCRDTGTAKTCTPVVHCKADPTKPYQTGFQNWTTISYKKSLHFSWMKHPA